MWSIGYGFAKNGVYCFLIGYIAAELTIRLFYDSMYIARKNGRNIWDLVHRKIDKYSYLMDYQNKRILRKSNKRVTIGGNNIAENDNSPQQGCWVRTRRFLIDHFRKYANRIYQMEDDFRFTTMVICTFTVAFIILIHLTSTFIFLYTTQKKSYISYSQHIFELILNIGMLLIYNVYLIKCFFSFSEVEEWSFQSEVILSAIITMLFYGIQLLLSIKNYRRNMGKLYQVFSDDINSAPKLEKHEIIPKSMQYPGFVLVYLLGGYVLWFHTIFFIVTILNVIRTQTGSSKWELRIFISVLILYFLQKTITRIINTLFTGYHPQDENDLRLNRPYSILMYINLISSKSFVFSQLNMYSIDVVRLFYRYHFVYYSFNHQRASEYFIHASDRLQLSCTTTTNDR
jgi:hypothetical protein